jgi:hypothetical protein
MRTTGMTGNARGLTGATALGALVLAGGLALGACSGTNSSASSGAAVPRTAAQPFAGAAGAAAGATGGGSESVAKSATGGGSLTAHQIQAAQAARSMIYTGEIQLRASDVNAASTQAKTLVAAVGGYVDSEVTGNDGYLPGVSSSGSAVGGAGASAAPVSPLPQPTDTGGDSAQLVLRVPAASYAAVYQQLLGLGTVLGHEQNAQDVTQQVVDIASRVTSAQASVDRVRALMDRAQNIADVTTLEQALTQRESDLESLRAQQQALQAQTAMSTVTVQLYAKASPAPTAHPKGAGSAILAALGGGWHALYLAVRGLLIGLAAALPFLVLLGIGAWLFRRVRALKRPAQAPTEPDSES